MKSRSIAGLLVVLTAAACGPTSDAGPRQPRRPGVPMAPTQPMLDDAAADFAEVRDAFLQWYFESHPVRASELGVHDYDSRLPDLSRAGVQDRIDDLLQWIADVERVRFDLMRGDDRYDYAVLEYGIRAELLDLEEIRNWANDPRQYTSVIARALAAVAEREYAPRADRAGAVAARMAAAPRLLDAARTNLRSPPRLWTEMAIADARGLSTYLETGLMASFGPLDDGALGHVEEARSMLLERLSSHIRWLESELLPRSSGNFRLGRYLLERQLRYNEHVSLSLDDLERINQNAIAEYRDRVDAVAAEIDPDRTAREIMDSINALHPAPDMLLSTAEEMMAEARAWVTESGVVALPPEGSPIVRDSPPYTRDTFTSLDAPGPFDDAGLAAFYNITNALPEWDAELTQEHLTFFSFAGLTATTLHETFPGHYVQKLYDRELSDVRKLFAPRSFVGGWAHYAAEMAMEEGFSQDPAIRLGQLRRALQHHARWYAAIHLHAMNEPIDQVVAAVMDIAYVPEFPARRDVIRATREPTYLTDALGRMQILEIRDDYKEYLEERDREFSLPAFHHELLRMGLPFPLAREALMPRDPAPQTTRRRGP